MIEKIEIIHAALICKFHLLQNAIFFYFHFSEHTNVSDISFNMTASCSNLFTAKQTTLEAETHPFQKSSSRTYFEFRAALFHQLDKVFVYHLKSTETNRARVSHKSPHFRKGGRQRKEERGSCTTLISEANSAEGGRETQEEVTLKSFHMLK